ncbi:MAG TPA: hypothetical protein VK607_10730 [Kofleriaceae bacterium]|nr:hypothetical protein [Kofleriaceae bacterium]
MSNSSELQNVLYTEEDEFCEDLSTATTALPLIDTVDVTSLGRPFQRINHIRQFANDGAHDVAMPFQGTVQLKGNLTGLGSSAAGAVPASDMVTFLGLLVGADVTGLATGGTFTGGSATDPTTSMVNGVVAGGLVRGGQIADGRVGGQWLAVNAHALSALDLLIAAAVAPAAADVLYSSRLVHPNESSPLFDQPRTFRMLVQTANGHFLCRGCFLTEFALTGLSPGEIPGWQATIGVAHVESTSTTFPSATRPQRHAATPAVTGSLVMARAGSTIRRLESARSFSMSFGFRGNGLVGTGGNFEGQLWQAARRTPGDGTTIDMVVDAEATGTNFWLDEAMSLATGDPGYWQMLYTVSSLNGRAVGIYLPKLTLTGTMPTQIMDGGYNRVRLGFRALANDAGVSELQRSAWRIGFA